MPANRFAPDRIVIGHTQDAGVVDRIMQRLLGRWPIEKCDIHSVFAAAIDWSDGTMVPSENINIDDLLNNTTGVVRALACLDHVTGLHINYLTSDSIKITGGSVLHRNDFKQVECADTEGTDLTTASLVHYSDSVPVEGNPSGLDSDKWYYLYANMEAAGSFPNINEFLRISITAPVVCEGYGKEHPVNEKLRFLGSLRTMATGLLRPFHRTGDGWVMWDTIATGDEYAAGEYGTNSGTPMGVSSGSWVRYEDPTTTTGTEYHQGVRHIPKSADMISIVCAPPSSGGGVIRVRAIGDAGEGCKMLTTSSTGEMFSFYQVVVNKPGSDAVDMQTFELKCDDDDRLDVVGYHETING